MKSGPLLLLAAVLVATVLNLLVSLGVIGSAGSAASSTSWEFRAMSALEMDEIGYRAVAADEGIEPDEKGNLTLKKEKVVLQAILPRTLEELQKDGWQLLTIEVTQGGNFFIFRRAKQ